uniref:Uncharacterized protein n=1 Tax=Sphaerodactylus townsendi TaxID=933632 RepID=A0ACB8G1S6_9SAUR
MELSYLLSEVTNILKGFDVSPQISEDDASDNKETNNKDASDPWTTTEEAFLQSRYTNTRLKEQLQCILNEVDNIRAKYWDSQRDVTALRAELRRIKKLEDRNVFLEAEIQAVRKKMEEEHVSESLEEEYLKKLKTDKEHLHRKMSKLSEESAALTESQQINHHEYLQLSCHVNKLRVSKFRTNKDSELKKCMQNSQSYE